MRRWNLMLALLVAGAMPIQGLVGWRTQAKAASAAQASLWLGQPAQVVAFQAREAFPIRLGYADRHGSDPWGGYGFGERRGLGHEIWMLEWCAPWRSGVLRLFPAGRLRGVWCAPYFFRPVRAYWPVPALAAWGWGDPWFGYRGRPGWSSRVWVAAGWGAPRLDWRGFGHWRRMRDPWPRGLRGGGWDRGRVSRSPLFGPSYKEHPRALVTDNGPRRPVSKAVPKGDRPAMATPRGYTRRDEGRIRTGAAKTRGSAGSPLGKAAPKAPARTGSIDRSEPKRPATRGAPKAKPKMGWTETRRVIERRAPATKANPRVGPVSRAPKTRAVAPRPPRARTTVVPRKRTGSAAGIPSVGTKKPAAAGKAARRATTRRPTAKQAKPPRPKASRPVARSTPRKSPPPKRRPPVRPRRAG